MTINELLQAVHDEADAAMAQGFEVVCVRITPGAIAGSIVFIPTAGGEGEIYAHPDDFQCWRDLTKYSPRHPFIPDHGAPMYIEEIPVLHSDLRA